MVPCAEIAPGPAARSCESLNRARKSIAAAGSRPGRLGARPPRRSRARSPARIFAAGIALTIAPRDASGARQSSRSPGPGEDPTQYDTAGPPASTWRRCSHRNGRAAAHRPAGMAIGCADILVSGCRRRLSPQCGGGFARDTHGLARHRQHRHPVRRAPGAGRHPVEPGGAALRRAAAPGLPHRRHAGRRGRDRAASGSTTCAPPISSARSRWR